MNARHGLIFVLALASVSAAPAGAKKDKPRKDAKDEAPVQVDFALLGDFAQLARDVRATPEQQKKFVELQTKRDAALEAWQKRNQDSLRRADEMLLKAKDKKQRKRIAEAVRELNTQREKIRDAYFARAIAILTPEQRGKYNGALLKEVMLEEFEKVKLDGQQTAEVARLCVETGARYTGSEPIQSNKGIFRAVAKRIYMKVLTEDQQKKYAESKRKKDKKKNKNK